MKTIDDLEKRQQGKCGNLVQRMMLTRYYLIFMLTVFINNFLGSEVQELTKSSLK